jgi:adenine C2-methylase RlmN of 23S rRNA A2503 and tRNA A37
MIQREAGHAPLVRVATPLVQLPKELRAKLTEAGVTTGRSKLYGISESTDGTKKFLCQLADGHVVETVGIPELGTADAAKPRLTACVSSQVTCSHVFMSALSGESVHACISVISCQHFQGI